MSEKIRHTVATIFKRNGKQVVKNTEFSSREKASAYYRTAKADPANLVVQRFEGVLCRSSFRR